MAKKAAKKKAALNGNGHTGATASKGLALVEHTLDEILDKYFKLIESVTPKDAVTQESMRIAMVLGRVTKKSSKLCKVFSERALAHRDAGGKFEHGRIAIEFKKSSSRSPAWKATAIANAEEVAELREEPFDADAYAKSVLNDTMPSTSTKVNLVESA